MSLRQRIADRMLVPPYGTFQVQSVRFIERLNGRAIIGSEMGTGKTWQSIAYLALHPECLPAVIVCPATIKWKWQRELKQFARLRSTVLDGFKPYGATMHLWKDRRGDGTCHKAHRWFNSRTKRRHWLNDNWDRLDLIEKLTKPFPTIRDIVIINYDILEDWVDRLLNSIQPKTLIIDEFHKCANQHTHRTQGVQKLGRECQQIIGLSGTPITTRPMQFFPMLHLVSPKEFPSITEYGFRYCGPTLKLRGRGWDYNGATNLSELHERVSQIMIRHMKADVMKDLPQKVRTIIPVDLDNRRDYDRAQDALIDWLLETKGSEAAHRAKHAQAIVRVGELKRLSGIGKLGTFTEWAKDWLNETGEKLVIFCVNKAVVEHLMKSFPNAVKIDGSTPPKHRQGIMDKFQTDPGCREIIGNIEAIGTGGTLTAAHTVAFVQLPWTPGEIDQAEDRVHRIGTISDHIDAFYFLGRDTVDEAHWTALDKKRKVVGAILDGDAMQNIQTDILNSLIRKGTR